MCGMQVRDCGIDFDIPKSYMVDSTGDDEFVGQVYLPIKNLTPGAIVDQWFDLKPRISKDPSNPGKLHLRLQRVRPSAPHEGFLSAYGIPSPIIPRRMDTGDLLLFNNQTVLSAGLRAITRCIREKKKYMLCTDSPLQIQVRSHCDDSAQVGQCTSDP